MSGAEFSRTVDTRHLPSGAVELSADADERAALARRFGLVAIDELAATLTIEPQDRAYLASGRMSARIVQSCAVSGEDLPVAIEETLALRFVPSDAEARPGEEEIELAAEELDEVGFSGSTIDLGEAVAQSLALAIDPYATGPQAEAARSAHGILAEGASGPLAEALKALRKDLPGA